MRDSSWRGERPTGRQALGRIWLGERLGESPVDGVALADGQVPGDVAALVEGAALHQGPFTEYLGHRLAQRLGAVQHGDDAVAVAQPTSHQIGEQVGDHDPFSVSPSTKPTGTFVPSAVMTRATTTIWSATLSPSIISTAVSRPDRSRASSSVIACSVAALNRRDTADFEVALPSTPTGSVTSTWRRVATPASIRSTTTWRSRSSEAKHSHVANSTSPPST